jgi:hypothetical protein
LKLFFPSSQQKIVERDEIEEEEDLEFSNTLPENVRFTSDPMDEILLDLIRKTSDQVNIVQLPNITPKFFICTCNPGYLQVQQSAFFIQSNFIQDMCVIIDLGPQNPIFLWIGKDASDRVKQLADQAAVVWLANCHDGRYFGSSANVQSDHF